MMEVVGKENIESMIYEIRGKQVMLDSDLAILYRTNTGNLNRAKKRNIDRFPIDFSFQLTREEYMNLKCQNGISKIDGRAINRGLPFVYTEEGVAMLSSVLHTEIASKISVKIMQAFVSMRKYISVNLIEQRYINNLVLQNTEDIKLLKETFSNFKENSNEIFYDGQIYDAYSKIVDIMNIAKEELIIIDGYADKSVLDMISKVDVKIILICKSNSLLKKIDIDKYNSQYNNLKIIYNDSFHDRYFILDRKIIYHCGASLNYAGSKTFSINKLEDEIVINSLLNRINEIICN